MFLAALLVIVLGCACANAQNIGISYGMKGEDVRAWIKAQGAVPSIDRENRTVVTVGSEIYDIGYDPETNTVDYVCVDAEGDDYTAVDWGVPDMTVTFDSMLELLRGNRCAYSIYIFDESQPGIWLTGRFFELPAEIGLDFDENGKLLYIIAEDYSATFSNWTCSMGAKLGVPDSIENIANDYGEGYTDTEVCTWTTEHFSYRLSSRFETACFTFEDPAYTLCDKSVSVEIVPLDR